MARLATAAMAKEPYPPTSSPLLPPPKPQVTPFWRFFWHDQQKDKPPSGLGGGNIRVLEFQQRLPECEDSSPHHEGNNPEADVSKGAMKVLAGEEEEQEEHREQKRVLNPRKRQ